MRLLPGIIVFCISQAVLAQTYPSRPITSVVGFAPGGGVDVREEVLLSLRHLVGVRSVHPLTGGAVRCREALRLVRLQPVPAADQAAKGRRPNRLTD